MQSCLPKIAITPSGGLEGGFEGIYNINPPSRPPDGVIAIFGGQLCILSSMNAISTNFETRQIFEKK